MRLWKRSPALYLSLLVLVGIVSAFFFPCLLFTLFFKKRLFWIVPLLTLVYVKWLCPHLPKEDVGKGQIHIEEVKKHVGPFNTSLVYVGKVVEFQGEKGKYRALPVRIYLGAHQKGPPADRDYHIEGTLRRASFGRYVLKPKQKVAWLPIGKTKSRAQWRYEIKETVKKWICSRFKQKKVQALMSALATGNVEHPFLAYKFNAVGLQHLLAISGFHFALLSFCLTWTLKPILPEKGLVLALIFLLTPYFFYMGGAPSIQRAWIAVFIHLIGLFFHWRSSPLNTLGVALLAALLLDPLILLHIGFQLSFAATLGILLFYRPFERYLQGFFPKRPFEALLAMPRIDQCGYLFCAYLRSALALQASTLPFSLPLILLHFKIFPLVSLFYNLFFPFLFSILLGLFLFHLDWIAAPFASFLILLIENAPKRLLFPLSPFQTVGFLSFCALLVILKKRKEVVSQSLLILKRFKKSMEQFRMRNCPRRDSNTRPVA